MPIIVRKARESSHVVAWGSSHVEARESSHVEAWGSSHVEARGSSHVVARESSHVVARGSSHVEAWENVACHVQSDFSIIDLFGFSVAIAIAAKAKIKKKSKTSSIIKPINKGGVDGWADRNGISVNGTAIVFKRVSVDFKTQEQTENETTWTIGSTLEHANYNPNEECGKGKYHACSRAYFCDEFRIKKDDRYIAIKVAKKDLHAHDNGSYPHKISFRKGTVLHECDRYGKKI